MGNSSGKEEAAEGGGGEEEKDGEEEVQEKKKEEKEEEVELPLGVEELFESGDPVLDISYKKFKRLPHRVCGLLHLEKLYLCGNRLRNLPDDLSQLQGLRTLALDFNKMEDVPALFERTLDLRESLRNVPQSAAEDGKLGNPRHGSQQDNRIPEFKASARAATFSYDHNPVEAPPPVREEVLVVGEGAAEFWKYVKPGLSGGGKPQRKQRQQRPGSRDGQAGEEPVIHGILKNSNANKSEEEDGGNLIDYEEESQFETQEMFGEGDMIDFEGDELEYDTVQIDYEYEEGPERGDGRQEQRA
ncbi:hypothetical protein WMY93_032239 [Mugilogobius chulae]|uniref:Uncharacterized protein n=1 Tax=Mugilogobius chulae TaxID=88201 RepID=A0AAW0MEG5_9GOBI